jgi:hypothetical protein
MKDAIVLLFISSKIKELLNKLFDLFISTIEPVRPDRKYPGKHISRKGASLFVINRFVNIMTLRLLQQQQCLAEKMPAGSTG